MLVINSAVFRYTASVMLAEVIADRLPPRSRKAFVALRDEIERGNLEPGSKLEPAEQLAVRFGVSIVTMRKVLLHLQEAGLVSVEQGRGTFIRQVPRPAVLVVEDDPAQRLIVREHVAQHGYEVIEASGPPEAMEALTKENDIALVISDVRMPEAQVGIDFIRTVRQRWPSLPLAAVTAHAADLEVLHGSPECPVLIIPKPVRSRQMDEALDLAIAKHSQKQP